MGSIRTSEVLAKLVKTSSTVVSLPASRINIGAQQYVTTSTLTCTISVSDVGGLDATVAANTLYYLYAVISSGNVYLIGSTNSSLPSGYTQARCVGGFTTNASSQVDVVGEYPGNLAVPGTVTSGSGIVAQPTSNAIINGGFDFWQRGTTFTVDGYSADRWYLIKIGTATATRSTTVPDSRFRYSYKITTGAAASAGVLRHGLETNNVIPLRGKTVTFSYYRLTAGTAYTGSYQTTVTYSNSTDAISTQNTAVPGAPALNIAPSTSWKLITFTLNVPTDAMGLLFSITHTDVQASGNEFYVAGAMLNLGTTAAPFQRAGGTIGGELALCQRYYEKSYAVDTAPSNTQLGAVRFTDLQNNANNNTRGIWIAFKVSKRTTPSTIKFYRTDDYTLNNQWLYFNNSDTSSNAGMSSDNANDSGFAAYAPGLVTTANRPLAMWGQWTADAEL